MRSLTSMRPVNAVLRAGLSLALAGTCLALPGVALATESTDASEANPVQELVADVEMTTVTNSGVTIEVPADYVIMTYGNDLASAVDANGSVALALSNETVEGFPTDAAEQEAFLIENCEAEAEIMGATFDGLEATASNGFEMYVGQYTLSDDEILIFTYVPMEDGSITSLNVYYETANEDDCYMAVYIMDSIALADDADAEADEADDADAEATVELTQDIEACGLTFGLPEELVADDEFEGLWGTSDNAFAVSVDTLFTAEEAAEMTDEDLTAAAEAAADLLDAEIYAYMTMDNGNVTMTSYVMVIPFEGEGIEEGTAYGDIFTFVTCADGSISSISISYDVDQADVYADAINAILDSVALA